MSAAPESDDRQFRTLPGLLRLAGLLRPVRGRMLAAVVCICGFAGLNVIAPKLLGDATDVVAGPVFGASFDAVRFVALLTSAAALYVLASAFSWVQGALTASAVQHVGHRLREDVEAKLHRLPASHFQGQSRGDVLSTASNDLDNVAQSLNQLLGQLLTSVLMVLGSLAMMLWLSPLLALVAVLAVPLSALVSFAVAGRSQRYFAAQWAAVGELNDAADEAVDGHETMKLFGAEGRLSAGFSAVNQRLYRAGTRAQIASGLVLPLMVLVSNASYVGVAVAGALQFTAGAMTIGGILAFIQFNRLFSQPLGQIGGMAGAIQSCAVSAARAFALLDAPEIATENPQEPSTRLRSDTPTPAFRGRIAFERVAFRYRPDTPVITDLSFKALPGQTVAIVGHTGAGKTTLMNLLMRFNEPDSGRITLDGVDIADIPRDRLRRSFGVVLQDPWLFTGTIRENIGYGRPGATDAEITAAAEASHVDHFVRSLPEGYATQLSNGGEPLSHGQRQLLSIARARLADRSIVVLDEATSSVDTRTEMLIRQALHRLRSNTTSFVIAHRLSTIRDADLILVMDHGRIVESGTHYALLERGGHYARLCQAQLAGDLRATLPLGGPGGLDPDGLATGGVQAAGGPR